MDNDELYIVSILVANGPDDCEFEEVLETYDYLECIETATAYHDKGHTVRVFDPYMGIDYKFPEEFGG